MKNPFNFIKRKADKIRKNEEAMQAGVELAARAKAEGWSSERLMEETMRWTDKMIRRGLEEAAGKDIDQMVDAMLQHTPDAKAYTQQLRQEVRNEFLTYMLSGKEPDLEAAVVRAMGGRGQSGGKKPSLLQQAKNPKGVTLAELERRVAQVAGFVKMMTGVANNAALAIMSDCLDKITDKRSQESYAEEPWHPHPRYRQRVKQLFNQVLQERDEYRRRLLYPTGDGIRFFTISDMPEETRRKYGVVSDKTYFEFWEGTGSLAYQKSRPLIGSLWNKFRLSMLNHHVPCPEQVAWGLVAANMLELAVAIWQRAMKSSHEAFEGLLTMDYVESIYRPFSLARVSQRWQQALSLLAPETTGYELDATEERNIQLGVEQIMELWVSPDLPFDATIQAVEDFQEDIFSTPGHAKKAMRELAEMRQAAIRDLAEQMEQERKAMLAPKEDKIEFNLTRK